LVSWRLILDNGTWGEHLVKTVRSRTNKAVGEIFDGKWKVVARRVIAEPTPRTHYDPPRLGIYDYDVVPHDPNETTPSAPAAETRGEPLVSFRKIGQ
jgi:hypothetical protein